MSAFNLMKIIQRRRSPRTRNKRSVAPTESLLNPPYPLSDRRSNGASAARRSEAAAEKSEAAALRAEAAAKEAINMAGKRASGAKSGNSVERMSDQLVALAQPNRASSQKPRQGGAAAAVKTANPRSSSTEDPEVVRASDLLVGLALSDGFDQDGGSTGIAGIYGRAAAAAPTAAPARGRAGQAGRAATDPEVERQARRLASLAGENWGDKRSPA